MERVRFNTATGGGFGGSCQARLRRRTRALRSVWPALAEVGAGFFQERRFFRP
jgi:hypothetical protein